jgi:hypothetical protein
VAEGDDRDSAAEVEIFAAIRVPDSRSLAANDRQIGPRVRRQQPVEAL